MTSALPHPAPARISEGVEIAPGRVVADYLGGGVDHHVVVVRDAQHGECVAKLVRPEAVAAGLACELLTREANALMDARHPRVVRCLDVVLTGARPHLLLQYHRGPTLRRALHDGGPLAPCTVAELGASLADALATVAEAGWVHLDVKPENVVAGTAPRLLDFSIAQRVCDVPRLRFAIGTPAYMAPEQKALGGISPHWPVGPPADVYALAVVLHEALTGRRPGGGRAEATLPGPFGTLLESALEFDPRRRPSARALGLELALIV